MEDDAERLQIREKISNMSFEELAKLKQELGEQVYNEAVFGVIKKTCIQKRQNKNRPTEFSSKIKPQAIAKKLTSTSKPMARDPRFDHLCGEYIPKKFKEDYKFIKDIKSREKEELQKLLKSEVNDKRKEKIRFLIQRMENQEREEKKVEKEREKKRKEYEEHIQMLREGKKPCYRKKSERHLLDVVEQYEDLKKRGKVAKVIAKYGQRKKKQDIKRFLTT